MMVLLPWLGLMMLGCVMAGAVLTGLPVWSILIGVACLGAGIPVATGLLAPAVFSVLPGRLIGLLESDILQALPLFAFMGALLNRLPLAELIYRAVAALFGRAPAGPPVAGLLIGAVLGPMNGSVGANAIALSRAIEPRLGERGMSPGDSIAIVAVASTLGVLVPPSLVLILLADAMMGAHTIALNATGRAGQILNAQTLFHGALIPAGLFLCAAMGLAIWRSRKQPFAPHGSALGLGEWLGAGATLGFIIALLAGVAFGLFYAVEAAAMGAVGLSAAGILSRRLDMRLLRQVLDDALIITGALFALLIAATSFTLVFRVLGSDKLVEGWITSVPGGEMGVLVIGLMTIALCAFVLDAFEIIFVMIPLIMPPVLMRVEDASWVAVLTLMTLQASFLLPPFGYALTMTRAMASRPARLGAIVRALLPYLVLQLAVLCAVAAYPRLVHPFEAMGSPPPAASLTPDQVNQKFNDLVAPPAAPAEMGPPKL